MSDISQQREFIGDNERQMSPVSPFLEAQSEVHHRYSGKYRKEISDHIGSLLAVARSHESSTAPAYLVVVPKRSKCIGH